MSSQSQMPEIVENPITEEMVRTELENIAKKLGTDYEVAEQPVYRGHDVMLQSESIGRVMVTADKEYGLAAVTLGKGREKRNVRIKPWSIEIVVGHKDGDYRDRVRKRTIKQTSNGSISWMSVEREMTNGWEAFESNRRERESENAAVAAAKEVVLDAWGKPFTGNTIYPSHSARTGIQAGTARSWDGKEYTYKPSVAAYFGVVSLQGRNLTAENVARLIAIVQQYDELRSDMEGVK